MKVLFWVPYPREGPSNRYRVEQYLSYLRNEGIGYCLRPFWNSFAFKILYKDKLYFKKLYYFVLGTLSRLCDILCIAQYDIVFIHRESYPIGGAFFETILFLLKKPFIFDFDDAIFITSTSKSNIFMGWLKNPGKIPIIIKKSSCVIAGNHYLADFALRYNQSVTIIPTTVDTDKYYPAERKLQDKVFIGWIGSVTTSDFLSKIKNVFIRLSDLFPGLVFKIVGADFTINGLTSIISRPWTLDRELDELRTFDIGIMPMPDNKWTRGKCGFKALLYMSMAIPCVCSPVGANSEIITDGINGLLADTDDEWIKKLSQLIKDCNLRKKIGVAARRTVQERYSLKVNAPKFLEVIKRVYRQGQYKDLA